MYEALFRAHPSAHDLCLNQVRCLVVSVLKACCQYPNGLAPFGYAQHRSTFTALPSILVKTQQITGFQGHVSDKPPHSSVILPER